MCIFAKSTKVLTFLSLGLFSAQVFAQSFCNASHSGTSIRETVNHRGTIGDVGYELWGEQGDQSATFYSDGSMLCTFNGNKDYLCRSGKSFDCTQTWQELGHLYADFSVKVSGTRDIGYSYIGIYGWSRNPLIEWYIVDSWGSQYRPGDWVGTPVQKGVMIDGAKYDVFKNHRKAYSIDGDNQDFDQYFSIRQEKRECGTIDITAHFEAWDQLGLKLGKMYEAEILGEAGNADGPYATGTFDFKYAKVYVGNGSTPTSSSSGPTSSATVERSPYSSNSIPGTIEFENFDYGGEGVGYHNADYSTGYTPSGYRSEEVEVIGVGSGYGVGYISANDWLEYTVNVASAGDYDFEVTAGTGMSNASVINVTAGTATAKVSIPATPDDWGTYSATTGTINLAAGSQIVRFTFSSGNVNVDKVKFTKKTTTSSSSVQQSSSSSVKPSSSSVKPSSSSQTPVVVATLPGILQFEDYQNSGGKLQNNGTSLGSIDPKAWVEYTVDFSSAGAYEFTVNVAREDGNNNPGNLSVSIDGEQVGSVTGILTDGWNDYQDFSTTTSDIAEGQHTLRVTFDYGYVNADYMTFTKVSSSSSVKPSSSSEKPSSSSEETYSSSLEDSSASEESSDSSSSYDEFSSSAEQWYSSATMALTKAQLSMDGDRNLQVFDMQGRYLGRVTVVQGASLETTLRVRFQRPGIYLVKQGNRLVQVRINH